jgi:hypothetical protein
MASLTQQKNPELNTAILPVDGPALTIETDSKETVAFSPAAPGSTQAAI